ncbi:MAG: hypothetical protein ACI9EF_003566 [Pseudohongiellaceae bacterium]|jgi:hypothetical protein
MKPLLAACLAAWLALSCAHPFDRPTSPEPYITRAQTALDGRGFSFFHVASFGLLNDRQYLQRLGDGDHSDPLPSQLADLLAMGAIEETLVAVGGACSEKSWAVLDLALDQLAGQRLLKLELLFLGDSRHGKRIAAKVRALGARYDSIEITVDVR